MALEFGKAYVYDGRCPGWKKEAKTPAGKYTLDHFSFRQERGYLVQFECRKIDIFDTEQEAVSAAQGHFNKLVAECDRLTT